MFSAGKEKRSEAESFRFIRTPKVICTNTTVYMFAFAQPGDKSHK